MSTTPDPHAELGVPPDATAAEVHQAFRRRLREHHPDTRARQDDATDSASDQALQRVLVAYDTLRQRAEAPRVDERTEGQRHSSATPPRNERDPALRATPVRWVPAADATPSPNAESDVSHRVLRLHVVTRWLGGD
jgi:curved DNA-binding protein CbpA